MDYIITIKSSKLFAKNTKKRIENFFKFKLRFQLKKKELLYYKNNQIYFIGFNLKIFSKSEIVLIKTKKNLNFKRIKTSLMLKKSIIKMHFKKVILRLYNMDKFKLFKSMIKNYNNKKFIKKIIKIMVLKSITKLDQIFQLKKDK